MDYLLATLSHYSNLITAIATTTLAALTVLLWFENRSLRKAGITPEVVAYLLPHPDGTGGINLVLANTGRGPAFDIKFRFVNNQEDFELHGVMVGNDKNRTPISVLPQDEKISFLFGVSFNLYGNIGGDNVAPLEEFYVSIEYTDIIGRKLKRERTIDIKQFAGLPGILEKSNPRKIADSLAGIEKQISSISNQTRRFTAFVDVTQIGDSYVKKTKGDH